MVWRQGRNLSEDDERTRLAVRSLMRWTGFILGMVIMTWIIFMFVIAHFVVKFW
jgi:hypothetical protein